MKTEAETGVMGPLPGAGWEEAEAGGSLLEPEEGAWPGTARSRLPRLRVWERTGPRCPKALRFVLLYSGSHRNEFPSFTLIRGSPEPG